MFNTVVVWLGINDNVSFTVIIILFKHSPYFLITPRIKSLLVLLNHIVAFVFSNFSLVFLKKKTLNL